MYLEISLLVMIYKNKSNGCHIISLLVLLSLVALGVDLTGLLFVVVDDTLIVVVAFGVTVAFVVAITGGDSTLRN